MKKRDASLKKFLKSKLSTDHLIFKGLRNKVTQELRKARANFFLDIISDAKGNCKKLWKSIDKLLGQEKPTNRSVTLKVNGCIQNDDHIVGKCFNDYFINSVQELSWTFPKFQLPQILACDNSAFKLAPINAAKVEKIISTLTNSKAKDIHGLDTAFLKQHKAIFNTTFSYNYK